MEVHAMMVWGDGHMGAAGWVGMAFMVVFWILVVIGLFYLILHLVRRSQEGPYAPSGMQGMGGPEAGPKKSSAMQMLEERYAKGEINRDEFIQRRDDLLGKPSS
jgi:putative membrane protein